MSFLCYFRSDYEQRIERGFPSVPSPSLGPDGGLSSSRSSQVGVPSDRPPSTRDGAPLSDGGRVSGGHSDLRALKRKVITITPWFFLIFYWN